jgi:hypothetical protein
MGLCPLDLPDGSAAAPSRSSARKMDRTRVPVPHLDPAPGQRLAERFVHHDVTP